MAYIGKQPTVGNFVKLDSIVTSATTTFNLLNGGVAYYPQSANHCLVSLNGILQAPTDSFTISGSTIIFSSALTTSDVIDFIIVLGDVLNIGTPSDNTVSLAKLTATGTKDATTFLRGDNTFAVPAGGVNTPAFFATATVDQSISDNVVTKVQFPSEIIDTNSCYDNATNYRFTPNVAGKYYIFSSVWLDSLSSNNFNSGSIRLYKNGSLFSWSYFQVEGDGRQYSQHVSIIDSANGSSDYYEIYAHCDTVSGTANVSNDTDKRNVFGAYKIIE